MPYRIGVHGPSGPLYLEKTQKHNVWWVINGKWELDLNTLKDKDKYFIVKYNMMYLPWQNACDIINKEFNPIGMYHDLYDYLHNTPEHETNVPWETDTSIQQELTIDEFKLIKDTTMQKIKPNLITTEIVHTINGTNVTELSNEQLLNYIVELEENIKRLNNVETKSKYVAKTIKEQTATLAIIVKHLDERN